MNRSLFEGTTELIGGPVELQKNPPKTIWWMSSEGPLPLAWLSAESAGKQYLYALERYSGDADLGPWRYVYVGTANRTPPPQERPDTRQAR